MKAIRKLKKTIIFTLAFIMDIYQDLSVKNFYRSFYWQGGYPYKKRSLHQIISRMAKVGEIERIEKNGEVYLKLSTRGTDFLNEKISLLELSKKKWDGYWRLVVFDIKEIERNTRDFLRRKLKEWGFVMWQESVYISPHPILNEIDEFLKVKKLFPKVVTMESRLIGVKNHDKFAWVVFKLGQLKKKYEDLEIKIDTILKQKKKSKRSLQDILEEYRNLILEDPFLPKNLIDEDNWPREKIKNKLKRILLSE
jgi:phenylacetic acid degradation operon negative regulatory protein